MIDVVQHRIRWQTLDATEYEGEVARLAVESYGHLLKGHAFNTPARYTYSEFADRITRHYDASQPRHAEIVRVLREIHKKDLCKH